MSTPRLAPPFGRRGIGGFDVVVWEAGPRPGVEAGRTLLYLHGFEHHPGDAAFLRRLARGRRVVAPEHPGYGSSTGFDEIEELLDLVLYYRRFVESLGVGEVDVVGHCLGGMFAAELAAICPQVVARLVLVDAFGLWLPDSPPADPFVLDPDELAAAKWASPSTAPDPEPSLGPADPSQPHASMLTRAANLAVATKYLWPIPDRGLRKRLGLVAAPALVVHGEADGLVPAAHGRTFAAEVPGAELAIMAGAGHLPMFEQEDAFVDLVEGFLAG